MSKIVDITNILYFEYLSVVKNSWHDLANRYEFSLTRHMVIKMEFKEKHS